MKIQVQRLRLQMPIFHLSPERQEGESIRYVKVEFEDRYRWYISKNVVNSREEKHPFPDSFS
jgi:hypothetical protein